jgi:hypothetical protein
MLYIIILNYGEFVEICNVRIENRLKNVLRYKIYLPLQKSRDLKCYMFLCLYFYKE